MYELTIENIKNAIRVDHDFDDNEILYLYLPAAQRQVKGAITDDEGFYTSNDEVTSLFNLAVINHIAHHYENRSTTTQFEKVEIPQSSLALIQALRGEYAKWKLANSSTE
ncbi:head-tail connector protein [Staphylococcus gallinarum]|uniref:head-tail connector protein n=1 Tax=Staphylococcus gallinarum TaxID=1293 RepID=UPI000E67F784|nr:head-tail connector protein [Staphylococcus gallinarum]RIL22708.1 phage gp6-like head-tail connector protein [Staphylococcus gallinarum]RIO85700.1 phage gp6-like head-tail connector protein [Staphylococcus gallinarum]